ncbi:MAG TPA: SRPBCC family protein [Acidimicrobiales bacterium]|nr:SRPBCC family protein [Acidimicrobiales bacterium]
MELTNEFRVGVPVDQAWAVLTDVERIAPCLPGAELQEVEGDEYRGVVKVKVGPITAQYKGKATFVERDDAAHRAVLRAEGRDTRGAGNANATITATLVDEGDATLVQVVTDLTVTGKVAQFGRGVLADVSAKLLDQFVESLEADVLSAPAPAAPGAEVPAAEVPAAEVPAESAGEPAAPAEPDPAWAAAAPQPEAEVAAVAVAERAAEPSANGSSSGVRKIESAAAKPVDLLDAAGGSVARRVGPAVGAVVFLLWVFTRRRRRKHR